MSDELSFLKPTLPAISQVDRRIRRQFTRQLRRMAEIAEVTKAGMNEIGEISAYATFEAARTQVTMNLWEQACQLSSEQKQKLERLKGALGDDLEQMTRFSSAKIVSIIASLPPDAQRTLLDELADFLDL